MAGNAGIETGAGFDLLDAKLNKKTPITPGTHTKINYSSTGLILSGSDATTADIADSTNKRYVTDANITVLGNTSNTNTGDETSLTVAAKLGRTFGSSTGDIPINDGALNTNLNSEMLGGRYLSNIYTMERDLSSITVDDVIAFVISMGYKSMSFGAEYLTTGFPYNGGTWQCEFIGRGSDSTGVLRCSDFLATLYKDWSKDCIGGVWGEWGCDQISTIYKYDQGIINPEMKFWLDKTSGVGYSATLYKTQYGDASGTFSKQEHPLGTVSSNGHVLTSYCSDVVTGGSTTGAYYQKDIYVPNIRKYAGKTVTIRVMMKADSALNIGMNIARFVTPRNLDLWS